MPARPTISGDIATRRSLIFAHTFISITLPWPSWAVASSLAEARGTLNRQDFAATHTMFELEAGRGNALAMNEMGLLLLCGQGVVQDCRLAYMWFSLAISFAPDEAFRRDAVENQFTTEVNRNLKNRDKSEAHRLGNVWMARHLLE